MEVTILAKRWRFEAVMKRRSTFALEISTVNVSVASELAAA